MKEKLHIVALEEVLEEQEDGSPHLLLENLQPQPQKLPTWLQNLLKSICLPCVLLDLLMQKWARYLIVPPYVKQGACLQRGSCCKTILISKPKNFFGHCFLFWNTQVHGFFLKSADSFIYEDRETMVMGCRHLRQDGRCGSYRLRPTVCRKWPQIEWFGRPKILKGCGFTAQPRTKNRQ